MKIAAARKPPHRSGAASRNTQPRFNTQPLFNAQPRFNTQPRFNERHRARFRRFRAILVQRLSAEATTRTSIERWRVSFRETTWNSFLRLNASLGCQPFKILRKLK
jgi:hypothetical protein